MLKHKNVFYIKILKLFSSFLGGRGVKGKSFNIKISLVGYNFEIILSSSFDESWKGAVQNIQIFHVIFLTSYRIQSISGLP
jgi:hypothetical protein